MSHTMENPGPEMEESTPNLKYVSCIRIYGQHILPPLMTAERREEMQIYRSRAEQVENKLKSSVNPYTSDLKEGVKRPAAIRPSSSLRPVDPHEILEEFDPFAPTARSDCKPGAKCRHSGSSDEFYSSKTDSSNNSVAMTNSTDLHQYMDTSGSTLGDGVSSRRSLTPASTPGTTPGGCWNPPAKGELPNIPISHDQSVSATYEGLNQYLDTILRSSGRPTPSDQTLKGLDDDLSNEEVTPTNTNAHTLEASENPLSHFQVQLSRREDNRSASCPLLPTPQDSLVDSAIDSLSGRNLTGGSSLQRTCAEEKLIDLANDPSASRKRQEEREAAQPFASSSCDGAVARLVRSNSYTLDSPSPMLLAHLEAERRKNQTTKPFTNMKQPTKNVGNALRHKSHIEKPKNGVTALRKNEGQVPGSQTRKDNQANKSRTCHSPPSKATNPSSAVIQSPPSTHPSPKNNRVRLAQSKTASLPSSAVSKTLPVKTTQQKEVPPQAALPDRHVVMSDQIRKLFVELQAEHNRQMEELLSRQRKEQELIRQAVLRQKDLLITDSSFLAREISEAGTEENHTWGSLLRTNSSPESNVSKNHINISSSADQPSQTPAQIDSKEKRTPPPVRDKNGTQNDHQIPEDSSSVLQKHARNSNPATIDYPPSHTVMPNSASVDLIHIGKETSSVSAGLSCFPQLTNKDAPTLTAAHHPPRNLELASFNSHSLHRAGSMSETYIDLLHSECDRNLNQVSNRSNTNRDRPSSSPALRDTSSRAFSSACDDLISQETKKAVQELHIRNKRTDFLTESTENRLSSSETLPNPYKDANGNLAQTDDLNCKNLLVSLDTNLADLLPAVRQVTREISLEDGVLTCYEEIVSAEIFPAVTADRTSPVSVADGEYSQTLMPPVDVSPRGRRKAWSNQQLASEGGSLVLGDPEWLRTSRERQKHWAATKIQAGARGYLVRRLLRTERVQNCITVIHDTILCALQLQKECGRNVEPSDLQLHGRLIHQLSDACREIHSIFIELPVAKRMAIISIDRERLQTRTPRTPNGSTPRPLSRATQIALKRKMTQSSHSNSVVWTTADRRKNWSSVDSPRSSRPCSSTLKAESSEHPVSWISSASSSANEIQRSASSISSRKPCKPWR